MRVKVGIFTLNMRDIIIYLARRWEKSVCSFITLYVRLLLYTFIALYVRLFIVRLLLKGYEINYKT